MPLASFGLGWNRADRGINRSGFQRSQQAGITPYRQRVSQFQAELQRARLYELPLTILVLGPEQLQAESNGQQNGGAASSLPLDELSVHVLFLALGWFHRDTDRIVLRQSQRHTASAS